MPSLNPADQILAKEEFARDRDNLTNIYLSQMDYVKQGQRGVSDKQFNLNIALATISAGIIGIVIPIVLTSNVEINKNLFVWSMATIGISLILNLFASFYAIYFDKKVLKLHQDKLTDYFSKLLDLTTNTYQKAQQGILTTEDIEEHYSQKKNLGDEFSKTEKFLEQKILDYAYYSFIGLFLLGLILLASVFIFKGYSSSRYPITEQKGYLKIHRNFHSNFVP